MGYSTVRELATELREGSEMPIAYGAGYLTRWDAEQREGVSALAGTLAAQAMVRADSLGMRAAELDRKPSEARSLAGAAKDLAIVAGILTDKAQLLAGQPTTRAERVDTAELLTRLNRVLLGRQAVPMALADGTRGSDDEDTPHPEAASSPSLPPSD